MSAFLLVGASQVVTGEPDPATGVRTGAAVAVEGGLIAAVGPEPELARRFCTLPRVDCVGGVLAPGFVDAHTHAVFGAWRAEEYALRCRGVPYTELARRGGGILASVRDLRSRSEDELVELTRPRLREMLRQGTTTAEVKSGYGLRTEDELKMLRVVRRLDDEGPLDLVPTFLGAHDVPPEFRERRAAYVDLVVEEMIPAVAEARLARFCDVFAEPGFFSREEARRILDEAGLAELGEVRTEGALPERENLLQFGHGELFAGEEAYDADPGGVGEDLHRAQD